MQKQKGNKIKRSFFSLIPGVKDATIFAKSLIVFLVIATFAFIFFYSSTSTKAESSSIAETAGGLSTNGNSQSVSEGFFRNFLAGTVAGDILTTSSTSTKATSSVDSGYTQINFGATGRLVNATANIYDSQIASPKEVVQYYANRASGVAYAANPTSGREVLTPIFFLSQAMRNVAYGIIVIILIISSLSILLSSISGGEQKLSIVQLMINAGISLLLATFFYEIAAIIYDLTVNYGNALVASVMEPFINARVILERLQPGGDINVTAMVNTFQFVGVADAFGQIMGNVTAGLTPAITQSVSAIPTTAVKGPFNAIGGALGFFSGGTSIALNLVASNLLGSSALFDAIIAWSIFFLNVKIFFNLLDAFIKFNLYVAFGPLLVLQGINNGFEKVSNLFRLLLAYGLVFPMTFFFILLSATAMNIFIRNEPSGTADNVEKSVLCTYSSSDPANTEDGILGRSFVGNTLNQALGYKDPKFDDPTTFRNRNYINQDIFDTTPAYTNGNVRSCRSSLFPVPWTFVPAPFGNYGNKLVQAQTIDSLVRTFLGLAFIIMAGRVPNLMIEVLEVKELGSLKGLGKSLAAGLAPTVGLGIAGMSSAVSILKGSAGGLSNLPIPGLKLLTKNTDPKSRFNRFAAWGAGAKDSLNIDSASGLYKKLSQPSAKSMADAALSAQGREDKVNQEIVRQGGLPLRPGDLNQASIQDIATRNGGADRQRMMTELVSPMFVKQVESSAQILGTMNTAATALVGGFNTMADAVAKNINQIQSLTNLLSAEALEKL